MTDEITTKIALFKGKEIRKTLRNGEWWFVIVDVVAALTESANPAQYLKNIRNRDIEFDSLFNPVDKGGVQIDPPLALPFSTAGGTQNLLCWNTEGIFRLIQSIPSSKAEPFKRWLAKVGYERVQEIENPELATKRTRMLYKLKGRSDDWIEKRMRSIAIHEELTDEWKNRGAKDNNDYAILTAEISKATFGVTPSQYKKLKGLKRENLRDHMNDIELILTMLGEATTTKLHQDRNSIGFELLHNDAKDGGAVAGRTRKDIEDQTKKKVISSKNYLDNTDRKRIKD